MKRAAIAIGILSALGFVSGFLVARLTTNVIPTIKEQRAAGPTRTVPDSAHRAEELAQRAPFSWAFAARHQRAPRVQ